MTTPKPKRPSRARKPKPFATLTAEQRNEVEAALAKAQVDAEVKGYVAGTEAALGRTLTEGDLKAKLEETAHIRANIVGAIERLSGELAKMQANLIGCDGALQVLGQLIETVEAKSAEPQS